MSEEKERYYTYSHEDKRLNSLKIKEKLEIIRSACVSIIDAIAHTIKIDRCLAGEYSDTIILCRKEIDKLEKENEERYNETCRRGVTIGIQKDEITELKKAKFEESNKTINEYFKIINLRDKEIIELKKAKDEFYINAKDWKYAYQETAAKRLKVEEENENLKKEVIRLTASSHNTFDLTKIEQLQKEILDMNREIENRDITIAALDGRVLYSEKAIKNQAEIIRNLRIIADRKKI